VVVVVPGPVKLYGATFPKEEGLFFKKLVFQEVQEGKKRKRPKTKAGQTIEYILQQLYCG
jgi:hypothetical protein